MPKSAAQAENQSSGGGLASAFAWPLLMTGKLLTVVLPHAFRVLFFFLGLGLVAVFGATMDRPSNVFQREDKNPQRNQWVSAVFYTVASLAALVLVGPLGFIPLAFAVLVVSRRRCAAEYVPYEFKDLKVDTLQVLEDQRLRYGVLAAMVLTVILYVLRFLTVPVADFPAAPAVATWALWLIIALKAADLNLAADTDRMAVVHDLVPAFAKAFGGTTDEWHKAKFRLDGDDVIVTKFPRAAVLKFGADDGVFAKLAGDWEIDLELTDKHQMTLHPVSDETLARREAEATSGGHIGGRIETDQDAAESAAPSFTFTAADL